MVVSLKLYAFLLTLNPNMCCKQTGQSVKKTIQFLKKPFIFSHLSHLESITYEIDTTLKHQDSESIHGLKNRGHSKGEISKAAKHPIDWQH